MQPVGNAGALQQFDRFLLQHAGADAAEDIVGAAALEDDRFDAVVFEQATKQQAGGTGTDDDDLRAYFIPLPLGLPPQSYRSTARDGRMRSAFTSPRAVVNPAAVAIAICGSTSHSSVHAAPDRSFS